MTEQQEHLAQLLFQQQQIIEGLNSLNAQLEEGRGNLLRVQGAIGYLTETGVSLPEPETEQPDEEAVEPE
jgi:autotransporter translocation and assembly factor TamB